MTISYHRAEDIAVEIATRMRTRTVAQGAETEMGTVVYEGRRFIDDSMIPCSVLIEGDDAPARIRLGTEYEVAQRYILFAYVRCDPEHPNRAAHAAIRDMKRALFLTDDKPSDRFGGKVRSIEYKGRDIGPRADGAAFVVAAIEIVVTYVEQMTAP